MAFVFGKAKKQAQISQIDSSPGPGDYDLVNKSQIEAAAPFHSSTLKTSAFDVVPSNTGPGCYDPTYQKDIQVSDKYVHMSSSFSSKVQRFKTEPKDPIKSGNKRMRVSLIT